MKFLDTDIKTEQKWILLDNFNNSLRTKQKNRPTWDSNPEPSAILLSNGMTIPKADALSIEPAGLDGTPEKIAKLITKTQDFDIRNISKKIENLWNEWIQFEEFMKKKKMHDACVRVKSERECNVGYHERERCGWTMRWCDGVVVAFISMQLPINSLLTYF